jgi:hypothetical protein
MSRASTALLDADLALAEGVIAADEVIDGLSVTWRSVRSRSSPASSRSPPTCVSSSPACA